MGEGLPSPCGKSSLRLAGRSPVEAREGLPSRHGKVSRRGAGELPFEAREDFLQNEPICPVAFGARESIALVQGIASLGCKREHRSSADGSIARVQMRASLEAIPCTKSKHIFTLILFDKIDWFGVEADSRSTVSHTLARLSDSHQSECLTATASSVLVPQPAVANTHSLVWQIPTAGCGSHPPKARGTLHPTVSLPFPR